jgi:6-phosphogluconolactonase
VTDPHELEVLPDPDAVARRGAEVVARTARSAVADRGAFALAVSGGGTPAAMLRILGGLDLPWDRSGIWQVDERVAPDGDPDRNLTGLLAALPEHARGAVRPMPVTETDLPAAADRYARGLPPAFDLVHLGLGDDGHTASLVPGDGVLDVADRDVAITGEYRGHRRMTLTYRALDRASSVLWLVTGREKAAVLPRLLASDPGVPAGRVRATRQLVLADAEAAALR